ncbi:protein kinase domain-containing protein [Mycobacterium sp. M23085]|uniref:serine/threonine-protein kinase n=1 Tax=Mycobacterium sp. M23085 TaxID=3378087 RepID=UPI003877D670
MGEVWRAHDTVIQRTVAIKTLLPHFAQVKTFEQRFRREARAAARLDDPHVVPIYDVGEINGRLYVAMRLINGQDLQTQLGGGPLEPDRSLRITEQIASALDAAHKAGLVHRDVKPSNILVTDDDFAYLIDFGIARAAGETGITSTGATIGTWSYMAPERFSSGEIEPSSDVYALTCVLYQSLTGELPFPGKTMEQVAMAHMTAPPPKPSTKRRAIPMAMDEVVATGLAKDPRQRYQTAKDLANAARAALNQSQTETVKAPAPGRPASKSAPSGSRRRWLVLASALTVILLAGVIAMVWRPWQREGGSEPNAAPPSTAPVTSAPAAPPQQSSAASPPSTTTMAALPAYLPPNSGCPGHVTAHHDIDHKALGPVRIFLTVSPSGSASEACIASVTAGGASLPAITFNADTTSSVGPFGFANPATDSTGNTFITYNAGGAHAYNGVLVLIPNAGGFEDIGWSSTTLHIAGQHAYLDAELLGPGADDRYTIRQSNNDCTPSCAGGTITTKDLHWNGSDYLP